MNISVPSQTESAKMPADPNSCQGHQLRLATAAKIKKAQLEPPKQIDESKKIFIKKGGKHGTKIKLKGLNDIMRATEEWKEVAKGNGLVVPNGELRLKTLPRADKAGKRGFEKNVKKKKKTDIEAYTMDWTEERLRSHVDDIYNEAKADDKTEREAQTVILKLPEYNALKFWLDQKSELDVKEAVERGARGVKLQFAVYRSLVKEEIINEKQGPRLGNKTALKELGLDIPDEDIETDLLFAFIKDTLLHIVLIEVKRSDTPPWNQGSQAPNKDNVNKAANQLERGSLLYTSLLADLPKDRVIYHTLSAFPEVPEKELETVLCSSCMSETLCMEDLQDWTRLSQKLGLQWSMPWWWSWWTWCRSWLEPPAEELLLTVVARLSGPHSLLHAGCRTIQDKRAVEVERMEANTALVDEKIQQGQYVVASKDQQKAIAEFVLSQVMRHATFQGPSGSGKTLMMGSTIKIVIRKVGSKILLIVLSNGGSATLEQLHNYLVTELENTERSKIKQAALLYLLKIVLEVYRYLGLFYTLKASDS